LSSLTEIEKEVFDISTSPKNLFNKSLVLLIFNFFFFFSGYIFNVYHKPLIKTNFIKIYILYFRSLNMTNYEELLEEAHKKIKKIDDNGNRFEIPKIEGHFEGKKTILTNFFQIASHIRRKPEHFQKFILRELATSGQREGDKLILNIKMPSAKINQKIEQYVKEFVLCKECKKPDTELIKQGRLTFVHCLACGAKHSVRSKI